MRKLVLLAMLVFGMNAIAQDNFKATMDKNNLQFVVEHDGEVTLKKTFDVTTTVLMTKATYVFEATYLYKDGVFSVKEIRNTSAPPQAPLLVMDKYRGIMSEVISKGAWQKIIDEANEKAKIK